MDKKTSYNELQSLIDMAEGVSANIEQLNTQLTNMRTMTLVSFFFCYLSVGIAFFLWDNQSFSKNISSATITSLGLASGVLTVIFFLFIYVYTTKIKRIKYKISAEKEVLYTLLNLVNEYKDNIYSESKNYVEQAIIEMRLKRIQFSAKW